MKNTKISVSLITLALAFTSCGKDEVFEKPSLPSGTSYQSPDYTVNAVNAIAFVNQLDEMAALAESVRTQGITVTQQQMLDKFNVGNPSLRDFTTNFFTSLLEGNDGYFQSLQDASSGGLFTPGDTSNEGGYFEGRVFDERGKEPHELIDKGLYGAALYNYATSFMNAEIRVEDVDKIIALFGANPSFPNSGSTNAAQPDINMANYAARRDKNDGNGLYTQFRNSAITLRIAILAGSEYQDERNAAIKALQEAWEKANAATIINYCHSAIAKFSMTNPTNADMAAGLHSYSEGLGFMVGWRSIPQQFKMISDNQIDAILVLMNAPVGEEATSYTFVTDAVNQLPKLQSVITELKNIYGFSSQDIEDFKKNWVAEQGR
ncbi:MAG: hypothetical protein WED33_12645 [Bacteroidia bacterium]